MSVVGHESSLYMPSPTPILVEVSFINFHIGQMGPLEPLVQPAFLLPGCGKRAQHLFILVFNHLIHSMSASFPRSVDSTSSPFRQDVYRGSLILSSLLCLITFFLPK